MSIMAMQTRDMIIIYNAMRNHDEVRLLYPGDAFKDYSIRRDDATTRRSLGIGIGIARAMTQRLPGTDRSRNSPMMGRPMMED